MYLLSTLASSVANMTGTEKLQEALLLMVIGMFTVFVVLTLVIYVGKGLILFVNKFVPEEEKANPTSSAPQTSVDAVTADIISRAVNTLTAGKGKVESITKI